MDQRLGKFFQGDTYTQILHFAHKIATLDLYGWHSIVRTPFQILQGSAADGPVLQADGEGLAGPRGRGEHGEGEDAELLRDRAALQGQQRHLPLIHLRVGHPAHPGGHCGPVAHLGNDSCIGYISLKIVIQALNSYHIN